jgi:dTDP-4-amino-4,6-dideoxygalactose transaminase
MAAVGEGLAVITTRERLTIAELLRGLGSARRLPLERAFDGILPLESRGCLFTNQGKSAFEQIVQAAGLAGSRLLLPAFFPDDLVGLFRRYDITPVFVDVDPRTYHLDLNVVTPDLLEGASALLVEHTFGLPADGAALRAFCDTHRLVLIEDCARALGASRQGRLVGSFGQYALFSLPKCAPVREGGILLFEGTLRSSLLAPKLDAYGVLHALTLVKFPLTALFEAPIYAAVVDTPVYPREVGNYEPLPARELDSLGRFTLGAFLPGYREALAAKRACAARLRAALEPEGFTFQADDGNHIYTSLAVQPPPRCDADQLKAFLVARGVKASAMWRDALGVSAFARRTWHVEPDRTPVAASLSRTLLQLPVSRFQDVRQSEHIIATCRQFVAKCPS